MSVINALELYSGIGGFHYAAKGLKDVIRVVAAVDINPFANDTYKHNFPDVNVMQRNIESVKAEEIDALEVDLIWMSPPCQPFTRLGKQLGNDDKRTDSFLKILKQILRLKKRPAFIAMENVKGFEDSECRKQLTQMLHQSNYVFQEFLLSPSQLGIPNSRLRYFLVAKLHPLTFSFETTENVMTSFPSSFVPEQRRLKDFVEEEDESYFVDHLLSDKVLLKFVNLLDVVDVSCTHSCCFTKGYRHLVEGSGSVLQANSSLNTDEICRRAAVLNDDSEKLDLLRSLKLRYFTSREVANIMGFPTQFRFPTQISLRQRYRLLGNSLNVSVVSCLLQMCLDNT